MKDISKNRRFRIGAFLSALAAAALIVTGCTSEAADVNKNLTKDADNFKITRRVTIVNTRSGAELVKVEGKCSVTVDNALSATVLCKTDDGEFVRHGFTRSTDTLMVWEQLEASDTSASHYKFVLRPSALVPEVVVRNP
jgi:hypothetical protein